MTVILLESLHRSIKKITCWNSHTAKCKTCVLLFGLLMVACAQINAQEGKARQPLTVEQKELRLEAFREEYLAVESLKAEALTQPGGYQSYHSKLLSQRSKMDQKTRFRVDMMQRNFEDKGYVVRLVYINDQNYPIMYGGKDVFADNKSIAYRDTMVDTILMDYLGELYSEIPTTLNAVTDIVSVLVKVQNIQTLESLFESNRLTEVRHLGFHASEDLMHLKF